MLTKEQFNEIGNVDNDIDFDDDTIQIGSLFVYVDSSNEERYVQLVDTILEDIGIYINNIYYKYISVSSPFGKACLGANEGDYVEYVIETNDSRSIYSTYIVSVENNYNKGKKI